MDNSRLFRTNCLARLAPHFKKELPLVQVPGGIQLGFQNLALTCQEEHEGERGNANAGQCSFSLPGTDFVRRNMEELNILGLKVLKRKRHSIPVGVRYWLFFKRHILETPKVNHDCQASLRFTLPRSMMPMEEGKEFHGLQAIYAQLTGEHGFRGTKGEELSVRYNGSPSFKGGL